MLLKVTTTATIVTQIVIVVILALAQVLMILVMLMLPKKRHRLMQRWRTTSNLLRSTLRSRPLRTLSTLVIG